MRASVREWTGALPRDFADSAVRVNAFLGCGSVLLTSFINVFAGSEAEFEAYGRG
jgi:hypothetical protein